MTITTGFLTVPDASSAPRKLKTLNDSTDGSTNPAHPQLNSAGAIINPATSEKQDEANTLLGQVATNTASQGSALTTIATNTALGSLNFSATPTVTAGAYTSGMVLGGKITVANAARANGGSGLVQQALVGKKTTLTAPVDLLVFHTDPTATFTDHALLPDISADLGKLAGVIRCTEIVDCGTPQVIQSLQQALQFRAAGGSSAIYVVPVIRGSESFASADAVTISLGILRD